jgi:hypothetical protein
MFMSSDKAPPVELLSLEMDQIMEFFLSITSTKAAQYLGVPMVKELEGAKDLEKARLAIDCTKFLVEKLQPFVTDEESKQLNAVVSNLQFAYVRESS